MREKVHGRRYRTWRGFVDDFELICINAMTYNQKRSRVHHAAVTVLRAGSKLFQGAEDQMCVPWVTKTILSNPILTLLEPYSKAANESAAHQSWRDLLPDYFSEGCGLQDGMLAQSRVSPDCEEGGTGAQCKV